MRHVNLIVVLNNVNMKKNLFYLGLLVLLMSSCTVNRFNKNIVIAHRGAWKQENLPQNSIASLNRAIELNAFGTEFDVHLTKDDIMVVNHDHDFFGIPIEKSTYNELLKKKHPNGESIPTLKEYLQKGMVSHSKTKLIIELKPSQIGESRSLELATSAVQLVKELKAQKRVEYISFSYAAMQKVLELDHKAKVHYLGGDVEPAKVKQDGMAGLDYNSGVFKNKPEWIKEAHRLGLVVNVWTVNSEADMKHFMSEKVDYITTDEPAVLLNLIHAKKSANK